MIRALSLIPCVLAGLAATASAVPKWDGCDDVKDSEIRIDTLVSKGKHGLIEPMKMDFDLVAGAGEDAAGKVDVYFTQRTGELRRYDALQDRVITLGVFPLKYKGVSLLQNTPTTVSDGLIGIALDPLFKANRRVYLYYTYKDDTESAWRVSRFKLDEAREKLDFASEEVIIRIPTRLRSQHPGGAMRFDSYGDLWIATGNDYIGNDTDEFPVWSSGNTNDLRGKILRIHPVNAPVDGKLYTIPAGNLYAPGTDKTLPEIYVMGARNPYTLAVDAERRWAVWGDVGPDDKNMDGATINPLNTNTEEHNLTMAPGNYGYPFFAGNNYAEKSGINPGAPVIPAATDWKGYPKGLETLPPAIPGINNYPKAAAITGPIYKYDGRIKSSIKLPPHFHKKWFITDFNNNGGTNLTLISLDESGKKTGSEVVMPTVKAVKALDLQQGPDGALYISNYAGYRSSSPQTTIIRVGYTGSCRPFEPIAVRPPRETGPRIAIWTTPGLLVEVFTGGEFTVELRDLRGRPVAKREGRGYATLALPEGNASGVFLLTVTSPEGATTRKLLL